MRTSKRIGSSAVKVFSSLDAERAKVAAPSMAKRTSSMTAIKLLSTGLIAIAMLTTTAVAREKFRGRANARHNTRGTLLYGYMGNSAPRRLLDCLARHSNMVRSVGPGRARQHLRRGRQCEDMLRCGGSEARRVIADTLQHGITPARGNSSSDIFFYDDNNAFRFIGNWGRRTTEAPTSRE